MRPLVEDFVGSDGTPLVRVAPHAGAEPTCVTPKEAEALCLALAAHLGIDVAPKGWSILECVNRAEGAFVAFNDEDGKWWAGEGGSFAMGGYEADVSGDTAQAAVEALSRDTATEPEP